MTSRPAGEAAPPPASSPFSAVHAGSQPEEENPWEGQENAGGKGGAPHGILVPAEARLKEGSTLWDQVQLGRLLGKGVQVLGRGCGEGGEGEEAGWLGSSWSCCCG